MRICRYQTKHSPPQFGWILDDHLGPLDGSPFGEYFRKEAVLPLAEARLLAPCLPSKVICVGRNYAAHAKEHGAEVPEVPLLFLKPPSSLIAHLDAIVLPPQSQRSRIESACGYQT